MFKGSLVCQPEMKERREGLLAKFFSRAKRAEGKHDGIFHGNGRRCENTDGVGGGLYLGKGIRGGN